MVHPVLPKSLIINCKCLSTKLSIIMATNAVNVNFSFPFYSHGREPLCQGRRRTVRIKQAFKKKMVDPLGNTRKKARFRSSAKERSLSRDLEETAPQEGQSYGLRKFSLLVVYYWTLLGFVLFFVPCTTFFFFTLYMCIKVVRIFDLKRFSDFHFY